MKRIVLEHGDGGLRTHELLQDLFLPRFDNAILQELGDSALLPVEASRPDIGAWEGRLAVTTDSYVVSPHEFPGGNIGTLAVAGTVNDLAVAGAIPLYLTAGFILEEGLPLDLLERITTSMAKTARKSGVRIVAGDTKVVPRGEADGIYINTAGVGIVPSDLSLRPDAIQPGDVVLINGNIAEHGVAILATRAGLEFETTVESDCAPLNGLIEALLNNPTVRPHVRFMRDATRGGLVTVLKEVAVASAVDFTLAESSLPVSPSVGGACDLLGLDPLYLANEGKVVVAVAPEGVDEALTVMRSHPLGQEAVQVGQAIEGNGRVLLKTELGGTRRLELLSGAPLPRIC